MAGERVFGARNHWDRTRLIAIDSRYSHRIAISNARILGIDNESGAFRYTDYADTHRRKIIRLAGVELLRPEHRNRPGEPMNPPHSPT